MQVEPKTPTHYRQWLTEELDNRKRSNRAYSLNAFSRSLGISPATLCQVLSGKRRLGRKAALRIIDRCSLSPEEGRQFLTSLLEDRERVLPVRGVEESSFQELELDKFQVISNWYYFAILSLGGVKNNKCQPKWIANQLGITVHQAKEAVERLLKMGLIERKGQGFIQSSQPLWVPTETTSRAIRKYHRENLLKAVAALEEGSNRMDLFSSITMVVNEEKLETARALTKKFRDKICKLLESGGGQRVFTLAVQLFPISKGTET